MRATMKAAGVLAAALMLPAGLQAQGVEGEWAVELRGGAQIFDAATAIQTGASIGLDAQYLLSPRLAVGPFMDYVRAETDGTYFIAVLPFGPDESEPYEVSQVISSVQYGLGGSFDILPESRFGPYLGVGGGGYRLYLDPQSNDAPTRVDGGLAQVGGGIRWSISDAAGLQIDARDMIYFGFDREDLNPIDPRHRNRREDGTVQFPAFERSDIADEKSTVHNFRLTLGFSYIPALAR